MPAVVRPRSPATPNPRLWRPGGSSAHREPHPVTRRTVFSGSSAESPPPIRAARTQARLSAPSAGPGPKWSPPAPPPLAAMRRRVGPWKRRCSTPARCQTPGGAHQRPTRAAAGGTIPAPKPGRRPGACTRSGAPTRGRRSGPLRAGGPFCPVRRAPANVPPRPAPVSRKPVTGPSASRSTGLQPGENPDGRHPAPHNAAQLSPAATRCPAPRLPEHLAPPPAAAVIRNVPGTVGGVRDRHAQRRRPGPPGRWVPPCPLAARPHRLMPGSTGRPGDQRRRHTSDTGSGEFSRTGWFSGRPSVDFGPRNRPITY